MKPRTATTDQVVDLAALFLESEAGCRILDGLAEQLATRLRAGEDKAISGWLDTGGAAEYLGITVPAVHRLTSSRSVTFSQEARGGKCWFRREDLDAYREAHLRRALDGLVP